MRRALPALALALCLLAPLAARAEESPQTMAVELRIGPYTPAIDDEFSQKPGPYEQMFGDDSAWLYGLEIDAQFYKEFGTLGAFVAASWGYVEGNGLSGDGTFAADTTTLSLVPLVVGGVYRFDVLAKRYNIPLVPVLKLGVDHTFWWIRDGLDDIAEVQDGDTQRPGYGGTWGLHWAASLHLLLDFFEPHTATVFDNDLGVNNSYLFVEYVGYWVNDFGSEDSFDLSHNGVVFGLAFEM